jgi:hypothetical protein
MSFVEVYREVSDVEPPEAAYERVLAAAGAHRGVALQMRAEELARHVRRSALDTSDTGAPGQAASAWLQANLRQQDDRLKRGAVAALALGLHGRIARRFPASFSELYPLARGRLAASLERDGPYAADAFSRDMALVSGLAAPVGALSVHTPDPVGPEGLPLRLRRTAAAFARQALQYGPQEARSWLAEAGARPWAELHLDIRALDAFNAQGFRESYHRIAELLRIRTDLAGLYGASWLYDPRLAAVSPGLAFVRRSAEDGGARIVRLKVDPVQTAFAVTRSPTRRSLVERGAYRPACYAMYWTSADLIAWADRDLGGRSSPSNLKMVRK